MESQVPQSGEGASLFIAVVGQPGILFPRSGEGRSSRSCPHLEFVASDYSTSQLLTVWKLLWVFLVLHRL